MTAPVSPEPTRDEPETMSGYGALLAIADLHYEAVSRRYPEGECAVCWHLDAANKEIVGDRFPCQTRRLVAKGLGLEDPATPFGGGPR